MCDPLHTPTQLSAEVTASILVGLGPTFANLVPGAMSEAMKTVGDLKRCIHDL